MQRNMCTAQYVMFNLANDIYVCNEICVLHDLLSAIWQVCTGLVSHALVVAHLLAQHVIQHHVIKHYVIQRHAIQKHVMQHHAIQ